jgi:hypothetical protein
MPQSAGPISRSPPKGKLLPARPYREARRSLRLQLREGLAQIISKVVSKPSISGICKSKNEIKRLSKPCREGFIAIRGHHYVMSILFEGVEQLGAD